MDAVQFSGVMELFLTMLKTYLTQAWPFALLHLVVIGLIVWEMLVIRREKLSLVKYAESRSHTQYSKSDGHMTALLKQFEEEAIRLGKQGLIVPMTDFSDRLDAAAEENLGRLSSHVSMLLTIGIAGTMFGVFEFAFYAGPVLSGAGTEGAQIALGQFLAQSMAKAFPVGFMGLILMFIFQVWTGRIEKGLQSAMSKGTRKALRERSDVVTSQAEIISQASEAIRTGLEPIKDLRQTLTESVSPVVESLGKRLDEALELIRTQFEELQKTTELLKGFSEDVGETLGHFRKETTNLNTLLKDAPEVLQGTIQIQEQQFEAIQRHQRITRKLGGRLAKISSGFEDILKLSTELPDRIVKSYEEIAAETHREALASWTVMASGLTSSIKDVVESMEEAANEVVGSSELIAALPSQVVEINRATAEATHKMNTETWQSMTTEFGSQVHKEYVAFLSALEEQSKGLKKDVGEVSTEISKFARNARSLLTEHFVKAVSEALKLAEDRIDQVLVSKYPDAVKKVDEMNATLIELAQKLVSARDAFQKTLSEAEKVDRKMKESEADLLSAVKEIRKISPGNDKEVLLPVMGDIRGILEQIRDKEQNGHMHTDLTGAIADIQNDLKQIQRPPQQTTLLGRILGR